MKFGRNRGTLGAATAVGAVAAAGAAAGLLGHRRRAARLDAGEDVAFGSLHSESRLIAASDGTRLNVEIDELDAADGAGLRGSQAHSSDLMGPDGEGLRGSQAHSSDLTVVFVHGWLLDLDSWHFQRAALRGRVRMVFYDQRSHGASQRSNRVGSTLMQLGRDLYDVIEQTTPTGPVILVGHSMGGMTIMSLADHFPDFVRDRVAGVLLCGTSAGGLMPPGSPLRRVQPIVDTAGSALLPLLAFGRRIGTSSSRRFTVGPDAPRQYAEMSARMLRRSRSHVLTDFLHNFGTLDAYDVLSHLPGEATTVISGTHDRITPHKHSLRIVEQLPGAQLVVEDGAGHMVQLERHVTVTAELERLISEAKTR